MALMSFLIWAGAALALIGALRLLLTLRIFGRRPRGRALALALTGIACVALGFTLPGAEARTANSRQLIDTFVPTDHFHESHWERIRATPREIFAAIHAVRPSEVHGFVPLLWARSPGARRPSAALMRRPILELMKGQHFVVLAEQPGREIVVGTIGQYWANRTVPLRTAAQFRSFKDPRYAKVAMNVRVRDEGNGWCKVTPRHGYYAWTCMQGGSSMPTGGSSIPAAPFCAASGSPRSSGAPNDPPECSHRG